MTPRRAKRYINKSSEWVVFTEEEAQGKSQFRVMISSENSWEILLNLSIGDFAIRETLRNIVNTADDIIANQRDKEQS